MGAARTGIGTGVARESQDGEQIEQMRRVVMSCAVQLRAHRVPQLDIAGLLPANARPILQLAKAASRTKSKVKSLSAALDTLSDGFAIFDRDMRVLYANKSFRDFFAPVLELRNGTRVQKLLAALWSGKLIHLADSIQSVLLKQLADGDGLPRNVRALNGRTYRWFMKYDQGGHLICLASDITAETERQNELEQARFQAEQGARARSKFLAHMSHELRTPLNGVIGMADLLREAGLPPEQQRLAETIHSSAESLLAMIDEVLSYAREEGRSSPPAERAFDLEAMAAEVVTLLGPNASAKGLDLRLLHDALTPTCYLGDPGRIRQVIVNLLGNAIKYTREGDVSLRILLTRQGLCLTVSDTGPGIPEDRLDTIFDEFARLAEPGSDGPGGTGLGLPITAQLVEGMGGRLWVHSIEGEGSTFGVTLPCLALPDSGTCGPAAMDGPATTPCVFFFSNAPGPRRRAARLFAAFGIRLVACDGLARARKALRAGKRPSLLLFSTRDGLDRDPHIRNALSRMVPGVPAWIMVNATASMRPDHGYDGICVMPMKRAELIGRIRDLLAPPAEMPAQDRPMRVLAVDDNATNRLVVEKMLAGCDIDFDTATDGRLAFEKWQAWQPDLILMDIMMPVLDGRGATRLIRQAEAASTRRRTRIVAITAHADEDERVALLAAGLDEVTTKPVRRDVLFDLLTRHRPEGTSRPLPEPAGPPGTRAAST